jgi:hypothetical protein
LDIANLKPIGGTGDFTQSLFQTPGKQSARDVGAHLNARTDFTENFGTLKHMRLSTLPRTGQCTSKAANATTHNED